MLINKCTDSWIDPCGHIQCVFWITTCNMLMVKLVLNSKQLSVSRSYIGKCETGNPLGLQ